jgi:hypothetical protein
MLEGRSDKAAGPGGSQFCYDTAAEETLKLYEGHFRDLLVPGRWPDERAVPLVPAQGVRPRRCRCQAFALTGDAEATGPACSPSPHHHLMSELTDAFTAAEPPPFEYRRISPARP